jgi:hypothetical protein
MFTAEESWKMSEPEKVVAIIKEVGAWRLGNWDGCTCSHFSIRNVQIDVGCGKGSPRNVHVSSRSGDYDGENAALRMIGEEVARQVQEADDGRSQQITVTVETPR